MLFSHPIALLVMAASCALASASSAEPSPTPTASTLTSECCGDINGDGMVSGEELQVCVGPITLSLLNPPPPAACDCNHNGVVSVGELTLIASNMHNGCPGTATQVPTPTLTPIPPAAATATVTVRPCCGDSNGDGVISASELQACIPGYVIQDIVYPPPSPRSCYCNGHAILGAGELTTILINALYGCPETSARTPTATPPPTLPVVCTPPPCRSGEVFHCPGQCPGGCGTECATPTATPTPTSTPFAPSCIGDCNADGTVTVNEIVMGVNIALGSAPAGACPALDCGNPDVDVTINCIIVAIHDLLEGCPTAPPTPTPTAVTSN